MADHIYHVVYHARGEVRDLTIGRTSPITTCDDKESVKDFIRSCNYVHPGEPIALINWILMEVKG